MHAIVNIALRAARDAAELLARHSERLDRVKVLEQHGKQVVTSMDREADRTIIYHLQKAYPNYAIDSRLSGLLPGKNSDKEDSNNVWLVDALNGSANANKGFTHFCVSIALKTGDRVNHAVVLNPLSREEFTSSRGNGAQLNATRLRVSKHESLQDAFVSLDGTPRTEQTNALVMQMHGKLLELETNVRLGGSPALDLVYVAAAKLDAGWTRETDYRSLAAALLILQESGALISDQTGNPIMAGSQELIFGNPKCFKQLLQLRQSL